MNEHFEKDPLDALRAADPVRDDHLPSASLARIRARVNEDVMTDTEPRMGRPTRSIFAAVGIAAAIALAIVAGGGRLAGGLSPGTSPGPGSASCVEQYSLATLANREYAFDGTVTAISGDRVTFSVTSAFRGVSGSSITLDANGLAGTAVTSAGGPNLVVGERYLVAGDATFVWACGFTQAWDAGTAADWAAALGG